MKPPVILPPDVSALLTRLHNAGFAAYAVGGCVRDSLRGSVPDDWDVTTAATPHDVLRVFADYRTLTVGIRHGTVAVITEMRTVEITTFRTETGYSDNRRPDTVTFVADLNQDLRRRDFTVNAIAYNDEEGLVDPFGGQADLKAGVLRCVGEATVRFSEDALRILRGLRFAAVLGFSVEPVTAQALHQTKQQLQTIAAERLAAELNKLLCGRYVLPVLQEFRDVLATVIPEIAPTFDFDQKNPHHIYDVYTHTLHALEAAPPDRIIRWAVLLHDVGKPSAFSMDADGVGHFKGHAAQSRTLTAQILMRLKLDHDTVHNVTQLVALHDRQIEPSPTAVKRVLNQLGEQQLRRLIAVKHADNAAHAPETDTRTAVLHQVERCLEEILQENACFSLKDLAVKGNDITYLGIPSGPAVGNALNFLLDEVIEGRCENTREALTALIVERLNKGVSF